MNVGQHIVVNLEEGEVRLGSERVRLLPARPDAFYLDNPRGPLVRALRFEERSVLLASKGADIASSISEAALVSQGDWAEEITRIAVSLALAGGGEEAPSFIECARLVEQQDGWDAERVGTTMALLIDKLCAQPASDGWQRIVFEEPVSDLETLISRMVANLSQRAVSSDPIERPKSQETTAPEEEIKHDWPTPQPSRSSRSFKHRDDQLQLSSTQFQKPPFKKSASSVSSVLPTDREANRTPARVLALNTDRPLRREQTVLTAATSHDDPVIASSIVDQAALTQNSTTTPARTNHASVSLTETAPISLEHSPFTFASTTGRQPFKPSSPGAQTWSAQIPSPSVAPSSAQMSAQAQTPPQAATHFSATTESPSFTDWLSELALLLEAECDMRGIDP